MHHTSSPGSFKVLPLVAGLVVVALIGAYAYVSRQETVAPADVARPEDSTAPAAVRREGTAYRDGQYEAVGTYRSPGGEESIAVSLTLADGVVTDATAVSQATRPNSVMFQGMFVKNFQSQVIGKNIDELNLTKVAGSSLTPKGFNDAVEKIKAQAQG